MENESFLNTTEDTIKMLFAKGKSDSEIAAELGISISYIDKILSPFRLPIKITGITISDSPPLIRIVQDRQDE